MSISQEIAEKLNSISRESEVVRESRKKMIHHLNDLLRAGVVDGDFNTVDPNVERDLIWSEARLSASIDDYYDTIGGNGHLSAEIELMRKHATKPTYEGARRRYAEGDVIV